MLGGIEEGFIFLGYFYFDTRYINVQDVNMSSNSNSTKCAYLLSLYLVNSDACMNEP